MAKNILKTALLIIFCSISFEIVFSQDYWVRQNSPTARNFKNCFFINNNTGWISGDSGTIIKTTNQGSSWSLQPTGILNDIQCIFFINERLGWAITYEVFPDTNTFLGTRMLKTTNGGNSWITYMYPDSNMYMRSIYFLDSLTGFMVGAPISIVRTGNAGLTWESMDTDSTIKLGLPLENIKFINSEVGYACGGFRDIGGAMWTTTNGGFNWDGVIIAPEPFMDVYIFDPFNAIAVGGDFEYGSSYVNTTDQGRVWHYDTLGTFGVATAIDFRTSYEGWIALGIAQKFTYSLDTGNTWTSIYTPDSVAVFDVQFTDSINGWAVGYGGAILKYNYPFSGVSSSSENFIPEHAVLYQNYPNPFNPKTIISYQCFTFSFVSIKVFDVLGNEVAVLVNENQKPGDYKVEFNAVNLPSGIYYYSMDLFSTGPGQGHFKDSKKMILLK